VVCPRGTAQSFDRGARRPAIEPRRKLCSGCRRCSAGGRQHGRARYCEYPSGPAWSQDPGMRVRSLHGNREISGLAAQCCTGWGGPHREGDEPEIAKVKAFGHCSCRIIRCRKAVYADSIGWPRSGAANSERSGVSLLKTVSFRIACFTRFNCATKRRLGKRLASRGCGWLMGWLRNISRCFKKHVNGLQSRGRRFDSDPRLQRKIRSP
jgi:hypothetical protein